MIYGNELIKNYISKHRLVEYHEDKQIEPASVDMRLGNTWLVPVVTGSMVNLGDAVRYNRYEADSFVLHPGQFALATTMEKVNLPAHMAALAASLTWASVMGYLVSARPRILLPIMVVSCLAIAEVSMEWVRRVRTKSLLSRGKT